MGLRTKLFLPAILGFIVIASAIHFFWVPKYLTNQYEHFIQDQIKLLSTLEPEIANSIVNGDLAALHLSLNKQLELNSPEWLAISIYNTDNQRLFPMDSVTRFSGSHVYSHIHPITFGKYIVATLHLDMDGHPQYDMNLSNIHRLEILALVIFGLMGTATIIWHNIVFRRPLARLENAATRLSEGDFSAPLPKQSNDEIGNLSRSFERMRTSLKTSQADLCTALLESQTNADKYRLEVKFREALYELQEISLSSSNRQELLDNILQKIISLGFLSIKKKGFIFLTTDNANTFQIASKFNPDITSEPPPKRINFDKKIDAQYSITFEEKKNHHQCDLAIRFGTKMIGIMRLYLSHGSQENKIEIDFLCSSADILASAINWIDHEDALYIKNIELTKAKYDAESSNRAKSDFLATMSHELRTPLNGVLGMAQLLNMTPLNEEQQKYVLTMISSGNSLVTIIDDILDLAKIESGKLVMEVIPFDLYRITYDVVQLLMPHADKKGIQINFHYAIDCNTFFYGDPGRIRQILINLISNAIKFTHHGYVSINISCTPDSDHISTIRVAITDSGIGIPADTQKRLFESFTQADTSTTRKYGGTGLGLAICKQLVELMGGAIGVNSTPDEGSTFWFRVNFQKHTTTDLSTSHTNNNSGTTEISATPKLQGTILVVEDNDINQGLLSSMLEKLELSYEIANNGSAAVELWRSGKFDLILMNCQMPIMDGFEATQLIRKEEKEHHIPIIALTVDTTTEEKVQTQITGMNDHLAKPFQLKQLISILERWLPKRH